MNTSRRQPQVAVIGAGSWGTAVAAIVARSNNTTIWARSDEVAEQINERHVNERLPARVRTHRNPDGATDDLQRAAETSDIIIMGVPSHGFRAVASNWRRTCGPGPRWSAWSRGSSRSPTGG